MRAALVLGLRAATYPRMRLVEDPWLFVPFVAGSTSIASLLGYFYGLFSMGQGVALLLVPGIVATVVFVFIAAREDKADLADRVAAGIFAGGIATLGYDVCRIPLVHAGLPIFKAIPYFGALILDASRLTPEIDLAGWVYHYSNGVGFALMYACIAARDRLWSAVAWGTFLETAMLLTPYAEVFGYARGREFLAITLGAHVVYGAGLWTGLRLWYALTDPHRRRILVAGFALPAIGVGLVGADFHQRHAQALPAAPPRILGPSLYSTWNVLEVDRIATLWFVKRFVDPEAEFALLPPFTKTPYGRPLDVPEAEIRRTGVASAMEVAVQLHGRSDDPALRRLGEIATFHEIHPWSLAPPGARELGTALMERASACGEAPSSDCLSSLFAIVDAWYSDASRDGGENSGT